MAQAITVSEAHDTRWPTAAALLALASRGFTKGRRFTGMQLREWVPELAGRQCRSVTDKLKQLGFVKGSLEYRTGVAGSIAHYTVTAEGAAAIKAAAQGRVLKSGAKGP